MTYISVCDVRCLNVCQSLKLDESLTYDEKSDAIIKIFRNIAPENISIELKKLNEQTLDVDWICAFHNIKSSIILAFFIGY